jgi:hypothetical protein
LHEHGQVLAQNVDAAGQQYVDVLLSPSVKGRFDKQFKHKIKRLKG